MLHPTGCKSVFFVSKNTSILLVIFFNIKIYEEGSYKIFTNINKKYNEITRENLTR